MANKPNNPSLWSKAKSLAKQKFDVYPSAYANGWAAKWYKSKGGTWRKGQDGMVIPSNNIDIMNIGGLFPRFMQDGGEPDGGMALQQMAAVVDKLQKLRQFINPDSDLEPWISSKLAVMDHYADAVSDYMTYGQQEDEDEEDEEEEDVELSEDEMEEMKNGGIPERYRKRGFTRVGAKRQSNRPGKKWMVLAKKGDKYKIVHGGYKGMQDYTQHRNKKRQKNFWNRMGGRNSGKATDPFSPLYWHKRFGTWQEGGELPIFQDKGYFKTKEERDAYRNRLKEVSLSALADPDNNESYLLPGAKGPYCINGICGLNIAAGLQYMNPIDKDRYLGNPKFTDAINAGKEDYYRVRNNFDVGDHLVWVDPKGLGHHSKIVYNVLKDDDGEVTAYDIIDNGGGRRFRTQRMNADDLFSLVNEPIFEGTSIANVEAYRPGYTLDKEEVQRQRQIAANTPRNPEAEKALINRRKTLRFEQQAPGIYDYYIDPMSGITDKEGVKEFLKYAEGINDDNYYTSQIKDLLKALNKSGLSEFANRKDINDALLNVFGQLGVENKWEKAPITGVGPLTAAENIYEKAVKPRSMSIGPGQIRFNAINKNMRKAFGINKPADLYDWNKVLPLMVGLDLSTRKWMRNQGQDFSKRITGEAGMSSTEMMIPELGAYGSNPEFVEGRYAPYFYRGLGSKDIKQDLVKEAEEYLAGRSGKISTWSPIEPGKGMSKEERQAFINDYVNKNLRSRQKLFDEGSYGRLVMDNINKYLRRSYRPSTTRVFTENYPGDEWDPEKSHWDQYVIDEYKKSGKIIDPNYFIDPDTGNLVTTNRNSELQEVVLPVQKTRNNRRMRSLNNELMRFVYGGDLPEYQGGGGRLNESVGADAQKIGKCGLEGSDSKGRPDVLPLIAATKQELYPTRYKTLYSVMPSDRKERRAIIDAFEALRSTATSPYLKDYTPEDYQAALYEANIYNNNMRQSGYEKYFDPTSGMVLPEYATSFSNPTMAFYRSKFPQSKQITAEQIINLMPLEERKALIARGYKKHGGSANHNLNTNFMNPLYDFIQRAQMGGQQQSQEEQLMQIIAMFAQMQGIDPQELMQQLQQLSAEEQQQAIMQMAQAVQQQGADGQQQMMRSGGMPCFECGGKYGAGGEMGGPVELPALPVDIYGIPTYGGGGAAYLNPYTDAMMEMAEGGKPEWLIRAQLKAQGYSGSALENKMSQMKQGGIHINPKNKGKFTAKAKAAGMGVQAYASKVLGAPEGQYPASTRRQANFARNAADWKKQDGGLAIGTVIQDADDELIKRLQDEGYTIEIIG